MGFRTRHKEHSITQVSMRLETQAPLWEDERQTLEKGAHRAWANILPRKEVAQVITIGPQRQGERQPLAATRYLQFGRDGTPSLWMGIDGNMVEVVANQYSSWTGVTNKIYQLLYMLGDIMHESHAFRKVKAVELTYEDWFIWDDTDQPIAAEEAIREEWLPKEIDPARFWHTGQGCTDPKADKHGKVMLDRWEASRRDQNNGAGAVEQGIRLVTTSIWGFGNTNGGGFDLKRGYGNVSMVGKGEPEGKRIGNILHERTKRLYGGVVTNDIAERVNLYPKERG